MWLGQRSEFARNLWSSPPHVWSKEQLKLGQNQSRCGRTRSANSTQLLVCVAENQKH